MIFLHQMHRLAPEDAGAFEAYVRDSWLPAVREVDGAKLAWFAQATAVSRWPNEAATVVALRDAAALDAFASACREGSLRDGVRGLAGLRIGSETRLLQPIDYDPWALELDGIPAEPVLAKPAMYMHDFVPPVRGEMRGYVDMMRERYMALSQQELSGVVLKASWQSVAGGGRLPEMFNLSEILDVQALIKLLAYEIPLEYKQMGTWMWEALATRDRWTTRLFRSAEWSPVR